MLHAPDRIARRPAANRPVGNQKPVAV